MTFNALAIIPARGGSKRIPRKNIKDFLGRPVITYSIEAAIKSGCFGEIMVSTDDDEIAFVARNTEANVPFMRTGRTSDDFATTTDVIVEVLSAYSRLGKHFANVCCIYPAAPFITAEKLKAAYDLLIRSGADSVIPVVRFDYPVQRALEINNGRLRMLSPENKEMRSQDLNPAYHDAGQFYWLNVEKFLAKKDLFADNTVPLQIPVSEAQDIDTSEDWALAEMKFRMLSGLR